MSVGVTIVLQSGIYADLLESLLIFSRFGFFNFMSFSNLLVVDFLWRTIIEAVAAILGGRLFVAVVVKGNKDRDDNKALLQTVYLM